MERLVIKSKAGSLYYNDTDQGVELEPHEITSHQRRLLLERLHEYEDTGLTPEQIVEQTNAGWIPVEERLPIPNKEVWVTVKRNGKVFTSTDGMTEKGHFWNYEKENILAWKEKDIIPEPYRPETIKP